MIWWWVDSPIREVLALLAGGTLFGLLVYGDFHDWWR